MSLLPIARRLRLVPARALVPLRQIVRPALALRLPIAHFAGEYFIFSPGLPRDASAVHRSGTIASHPRRPPPCQMSWQGRSSSGGISFKFSQVVRVQADALQPRLASCPPRPSYGTDGMRATTPRWTNLSSLPRLTMRPSPARSSRSRTRCTVPCSAPSRSARSSTSE